MAEARTLAVTPRRIPPRASRLVAIWALRLGLLAIVLGAWIVSTQPGGISPLILPSPIKVGESFISYVVEGDTWVQAAITIGEILAAFAIAAVVGLGVGFLVGRNRILARATEPVLAWGYMFPFALLYPLFLLWVGVGVESKIYYAAAGAFFPIAYNTIRGLRSVSPRYLKVGQAFGASRLRVDLDIKAGAARPMILSGLRIGMSIVTISVVLGELLGSNAGLGHEIETAQSRLQTADTYGVALLLIILTVLVQAGMERVLQGRRSAKA